MSLTQGYVAGINLGGWLSQYRADAGEEHFASFITQEDIALIASWGADHVRVPVDYRTLLRDDAPYDYLESGFSHIDDCIGWCKKHGLNMIIDLHDAPGYHFFRQEGNVLFDDAEKQNQLIQLWKAIASRYANEGPGVRYELLNEVKADSPDPWNKLAAKLIEGIRSVDASHAIIVGGIDMNGVHQLKNIARFADEKIVYNFHTYEPGMFTHQRAPFIPMLQELDLAVRYPCPSSVYLDVLERMKKSGLPITTQLESEPYTRYPQIGRDFLFERLKPAADFVAETGLPVYCGEYGVIDLADIDSRANWTNDVADFCLAHNIGRAIWSYKRMNFRLIEEDRSPISEALIKAAVKR